jgi:ADP-heptose:LPS heptosyltransferase
VQQPWDLLINWSYSESSSYLTALLPAYVKLGYSRRPDCSFASLDGWSHYIQAIVQGKIEQNIHLTDILTTQILTALQIHFGEPTDNGNAAITSRGFFSLDVERDVFGSEWPNSSKKWIGIQLGASNTSKSWQPESWAKLASMILSKHRECGIVLLGNNADNAKAKIFFEKLKVNDMKILSLVGETSFDLWASAVSRCHWLFSGDTAALHLASVLGTRVLNISVGPVRWMETGPYGNGHYIVSSSVPCPGCEAHSQDPSSHVCRDSISPEAVYAVWAYGSNEWAHRRNIKLEDHFKSLGFDDHLECIQVLRSRIRPISDGGGVVFEPMSARPLHCTEWVSQVMGHIARTWYCGWVPKIGQDLRRENISPALIQKLRELNESVDVLLKILNEAKRTSLALAVRSSKLRSQVVMEVQDQDELRNLGQKLMELDKLAERIARAQPALSAFAHMAKVLMHNLKGEKISELGQQSANAYEQLHQGVGIFKQWIDHTMALARPVAIRDKDHGELTT